MSRKIDKSGQRSRPHRIRVPNKEKAIFTVHRQKFLGILRCLSQTGGSVLLAKGTFPEGTLAEIALSTTLGKVTGHIEFLHLGADGVAHAQAFRFLAMDEISTQRYLSAVQQMQIAGFSDIDQPKPTLVDTMFEGWNNLRQKLNSRSHR